MTTISCTTLRGEKKDIDVSKIVVRPTAYAVIIDNDKVLLVKVKTTGKWFLPGGGVEQGEDLVTGLRREVKEELGVEIDVGEPLVTKQHYFYYDPLDEAYDMRITVFRCVITSGRLSDLGEPGEETKAPQWVPIASLRYEDFDDVLHDVVTLIQHQT